jgi:hypothetical protein
MIEVQELQLLTDLERSPGKNHFSAETRAARIYGATAMSTPEKPNVEFDAPEERTSAEELYSDPAERAVFGKYGGMAGFWRFIIPIVLLLAAAGMFFATIS